MKKTGIRLLLPALCWMLAGCGGGTAEEPAAVYSFHGENALFSLSNGVIVLTTERDTIFCGDLEEKQGASSEIVSYTEELYVLSNGEKLFLLSLGASDETGESAVSLSHGSRRSGKDLIQAAKEDLKENLYLELTTTDRDGRQNEYQIALEVTEVTR